LNVTEACIKRPVLTIVLSLVLIIVGLISYDRLTVRQYPNINKPVVTVITTYPGASAQLVESEVTIPLEKTLATISGVESIHSNSAKGKSNIHLQFKMGTDTKDKVDEARNRVSNVYGGFPSEVDPPVVLKSESDAVQTIILSVFDETRTALELTDYLDRYIKTSLEQVEGVGQVDIWGAREYAMRIFPQPARMAARGVSTSDINQALEAHTADIPSGQVKGISRNYSIVLSSKLQRVDEFKQLIVYEEDGKVVRLGDVANINIAASRDEGAFRVNGKQAIGISISSQPTANPIDVADNVIQVLDSVRAAMPEGMNLKVVYNVATFIKYSLRNVYESIVEATLLVLLVVFLFLGSIRSASIPIVTIPICIISSFGVLYLLGYSINTVTLLPLLTLYKPGYVDATSFKRFNKSSKAS